MSSILYKVIGISEDEPCEECIPGFTLRLMELGFIEGALIEINDYKHGFHVVSLLNDTGGVETTYVIKDHELNRIKKVRA